MKTQNKHSCYVEFSEEDYQVLKERARKSGLKPTGYVRMVAVQSINLGKN
jgi:hypothetical protein